MFTSHKWSRTLRPHKSYSNASSASQSSTAVQYCVDLVKKRDYEHFLATLLLPHHVRQSAFAIRAFNVEISTVRDSVSERTIGLMRMQFWRDTVESIFGGKCTPKQPIAIELHRAVDKHRLSKDLFLRVISSRESLLADKPFSSLDELDSYSRDAFCSLNYLLLECLNSEESKTGHARHAASQLGKAQGAVTLLRGVPYNASRRRVLLPSDLMAAHQLSAETVMRNAKPENLRLVVEAVAARAQEHLDNCRFRMKYLDKDERRLMLPAVAVDSYLATLHRVQCDVFNPSLQRRNSWLPLSLYYHKWRNSY